MQIFSNQEFGNIRVVRGENGEPWFVGKDVAKVLGYAKPLNAVATHVDSDDSLKQGLIDSIGRKQKAIFVNESGLYSLVMSSKLPEAKKFKRWVTSEVLPTIRKHGAYLTDSKLTDIVEHPELLHELANTLQKAKEERMIAEQKNIQLQLENKQLQEKANYLDIILASDSSVNVRQISQDYGMSAEKFNEMLHEKHVQYYCHNQWILYAEYKDKGYVTSETITLRHKNGTPFFKLCTKWTAKGRAFLYEFLKEQGILPLIEKENLKKEPLQTAAPKSDLIDFQ